MTAHQADQRLSGGVSALVEHLSLSVNRTLWCLIYKQFAGETKRARRANAVFPARTTLVGGVALMQLSVLGTWPGVDIASPHLDGPIMAKNVLSKNAAGRWCGRSDRGEACDR